MIILGAFLNSFVIGGIASEMQNADDKQQKNQKIVDYVNYSMDIHKTPEVIRKNVKKYMQNFEEVTSVQECYFSFLQYLNPFLRYCVIDQLYYKTLSKNWLFLEAQQDQVMFIADYMKAQISIADEILLLQGDSAKTLYIITEGSVSVFLKESPIDLFSNKINYQKLCSRMKLRYLRRVGTIR